MMDVAQLGQAFMPQTNSISTSALNKQNSGTGFHLPTFDTSSINNMLMQPQMLMMMMQLVMQLTQQTQGAATAMNAKGSAA